MTFENFQRKKKNKKENLMQQSLKIRISKKGGVAGGNFCYFLTYRGPIENTYTYYVGRFTSFLIMLRSTIFHNQNGWIRLLHQRLRSR